MKIKGTRDDFLNCLQKVSNAAQDGNIMPILANVLIEADTESTVITATDQETLVRASCPIKANKKFDATVSAKTFQAILTKLPAESTIAFDYQEGKDADSSPTINITAGKTHYKLNSLPSADFPMLGAKQKLKPLLKIPADKLLRGLNRVNYSAAVNSHRLNLNGVMIEGSIDGLRLVATDGHRMAVQTIDDKKIDESMQLILPRKSVSELMRNLPLEEDKEIKIEASDKVVRFIAQDFEIISNVIAENFPDYRSVIPQNNDKVITIGRDLLKDSLHRVTTITNKGDTVVLKLDKDIVILESTNQSGEEAKDEVAITYKGEKMEIGFNNTFLLDMLSALEEDNLKISVLDTTSSVLIEASEGKDFNYVVMPIRL